MVAWETPKVVAIWRRELAGLAEFVSVEDACGGVVGMWALWVVLLF